MTKSEDGSSFQPRLGTKLEIAKPSNLIARKCAVRQSAGSGLDIKSIEAEVQDAMKSFANGLLLLSTSSSCRSVLGRAS